MADTEDQAAAFELADERWCRRCRHGCGRERALAEYLAGRPGLRFDPDTKTFSQGSP